MSTNIAKHTGTTLAEVSCAMAYVPDSFVTTKGQLEMGTPQAMPSGGKAVSCRKYSPRFIVAVVLATLGWASGVHAMSYRDNHITFSISGSEYSLVGGSFTVESFFIPKGQDPKEKIYAGLEKPFGENGTITFSVGRNGSDDAATWFNTRIPASQTTFNKKPGALNFAFLGTLTLRITGGILGGGQDTYTFSNIGIAQGTTKNWWFGGQNCANISPDRVSCQGVSADGTNVGFVFQRGSNGISTVGVTPVTIVGTLSWMGKMNDTITLDRLVIPGSHDAGMSETHHCHFLASFDTGYVLTQGDSIGGQLVNGSRYFDIRVDYDHNELVTYHRSDSIGCNGQSLKAVLDETVAFLKSHGKETAIIKISHIRGDREDEDRIIKKIDRLLTNDYSEAMYNNVNEDVNLAEIELGGARGKMIIVFDYSDNINPNTGRFRYKNGSSCARYQGGGMAPCTTKERANLTVCDCYADTASYDKMKSDQLGRWNEWADPGAGYLFLLSWTLTANTPVIEPTIKTLARRANSRLPGVLYDQIVESSAKNPNVVYVDYLDSPTAQSIIQYNF